MRAAIKKFVKSTIMATPPGRRFFDRVAALRERGERLSIELAFARARIVAADRMTEDLDVAQLRVRELEAAVRRTAEEKLPQHEFVLRNKKQALGLLASKGFLPDLVVDVGAHARTVGLYDTWPTAHYILIEPVSQHTEALQNVCNTLASAEFKIAAAGASPGELALAFNPEEPMHLDMPQRAPAHWTRFVVPVITVDNVLTEARTQRQISNALIKIDVDGPEISVLQGSEASLNEGRHVYLVEAALLDTDAGRIGEIINHMTSRGYELFDIIEPLMRPLDQILWQVDMIFVPKDSPLRSNRRYE